jgi:phage shock protein E
MIVLRRFLGVIVPLLLVPMVLSGCATAPESPAGAAVDPGATVVDVRTPAEYASGHLAGARNIDLQSPSFAAEVGRLDRAGAYVVYCRSGNRSAQAAQLMTAMGFTDVRDAGSLAQAQNATGLAVVAG